MPQKMSVTVPLTARQKEQIKKATGKTISALKVESAGSVALSRNFARVARGNVLLAKKASLTRANASMTRAGASLTRSNASMTRAGASLTRKLVE